VSLLWGESNFSKWDGNLVGIKEGSSLVLMKLDASEWSRDE
jgi:hypothetical protein